jgi:hypothetical protein
MKHEASYPGWKIGDIAVELGILKRKDIDEYLEGFE